MFPVIFKFKLSFSFKRVHNSPIFTPDYIVLVYETA